MPVSNEIDVPFPIMRYDITMPILEHRVDTEGINFKPGHFPHTMGTDIPEYRTGDFGLADFNLAWLIPAVQQGWEIIALPIFPKRKPVYQYVFVRTDAGIQTAKDLEGKRIGSWTYRTAITVWLRGFLHHRHDVDTSKLSWLVQFEDIFPLYDDKADIKVAEDPTKPAVERLLDGEVDAIIGDISDGKLFDALEASPNTERLFPDYVGEDLRLYDDTGIYTPMHIMVMSRKLDQAYPDLGGRLCKIFEEAKQLAYQDIQNDRAGFSVVYLRERFKEQLDRWGDPFKYGMEVTKHAMDIFKAYSLEQGMIKNDGLSTEELFARSSISF
jgi:4,5-dihydroxyphthalate decarboxylase